MGPSNDLKDAHWTISLPCSSTFKEHLASDCFITGI